MLVFPQLVTGAVALYPVTRQSVLRTVVNTLADGSTVVYSDPAAAKTMWELQAKGLTADEWNSIEALFDAVGGQWQTFTLLDPAGNLFANSELLSAGSWSNGALMSLTAGIGDPLGTTRATRVVNGGIAAESVAQALNAPGNFQYCLSTWAKTIGGSSVTLTASAPGGGTGANTAVTFALTTNWQQISIPVNLAQATVSMTFGAELAAGATVDLFGMQVEAQLGASDYKMTGINGGVYANARFASDSLTVVAQSTDVYDATIRIMAAGS
jgi:hypothetical protein